MKFKLSLFFFLLFLFIFSQNNQKLVFQGEKLYQQKKYSKALDLFIKAMGNLEQEGIQNERAFANYFLVVSKSNFSYRYWVYKNNYKGNIFYGKLKGIKKYFGYLNDNSSHKYAPLLYALQIKDFIKKMKNIKYQANAYYNLSAIYYNRNHYLPNYYDLGKKINIFKAIFYLKKSIAISQKDSKISKIRQEKLKKYQQELAEKSKQIRSLFAKKDNYQFLLKTTYSNRYNPKSHEYFNIFYYTLTNSFTKKEKITFFKDMFSFFSKKYTEAKEKEDGSGYDYTYYHIFEKVKRLVSFLMRYEDDDLIKIWEDNYYTKDIKKRYFIELLRNMYFIEDDRIIKILINAVEKKQKQKDEYFYSTTLREAVPKIKQEKNKKKNSKYFI